jgi:hypothetical protein
MAKRNFRFKIAADAVMAHLIFRAIRRIFLPRRANQLFRSFRHPTVQATHCAATALALTIEAGFLIDVGSK